MRNSKLNGLKTISSSFKDMKSFKYLYYRLYTWNLKTWGESDLPQWNALLGVSFMMFLNLCLFGMLFQFLGLKIFLRDEIPKIEITLVMLGLFVLNYFLFIYQKKYQGFVKEIPKETLKRRRRNTVLIWLYVILSFSLFIFLAIVFRKTQL
jgi:hypothetical protein